MTSEETQSQKRAGSVGDNAEPKRCRAGLPNLNHGVVGLSLVFGHSATIQQKKANTVDAFGDVSGISISHLELHAYGAGSNFVMSYLVQ